MVLTLLFVKEEKMNSLDIGLGEITGRSVKV